MVGFAAETQHVIENAKRKCEAKQLDMIIANDVSQGQVFHQDDNTISMISSKDSAIKNQRGSKQSLAYSILEEIYRRKFKSSSDLETVVSGLENC